MLLSFVVGSSILVTFPFFWKVGQLDQKVMNYNYFHYSIIAPIFLGLATMLSVYLKNTFNLSLRQSILIVSVCSPLLVTWLAEKVLKSYNFTARETCDYKLRLFLKHFIIYNFVIYNLLKMLKY